jgi:4-hydroxy-tetrahydrodipicolinate synthase
MTPVFKRKPIKGLFPLLPFSQTKNFDVDYEAIRGCIRFLKEHKIHGFIAFGCMGQHFAPSEDEFNKVTDVCIDEANGEICSIIGSTAPTTNESIRRLQYAEDAGADGSMLAPPYALTLDREMCAWHYQQCNDALKGDLAIMAYNFPPLARGFNMTLNYMWEDYLHKMENLKALKESTASHDRLLFNMADKINILSGGETSMWRNSMLGGVGSVGQLSWVAPKHMLRLYEECMKKNHFDPWVLQMYKAMIAPTSYSGEPIGTPGTTWEVALLNHLVEIGGNKAGPPRPPYRPFPPAWLEQLKKNVERIRSVPL